MRRRIYFLLPNVGSARQVVNELLLARIDDHHIHVMAREGIALGDLPQANLLQRSDFVHGVEIGLSVGGATGIVAGLIAVAFPLKVLSSAAGPCSLWPSQAPSSGPGSPA